jgi:hypothetical protein
MNVNAHAKEKYGTARLVDVTRTLGGSGATSIGARVAIGRERSVALGTLPAVVHPNYVRIKQRRSFLCRCTADPSRSWRYDFTLTWGAKTKDAAERAVRTTSPTYEVEIETPGKVFLNSYPPSYIATSLVLKVADLVQQITTA